MRKSVLPVLLLFLFSSQLLAQPCAFDLKHKDLLDSNPFFANQVQQNNAVIQKYIEAQKSTMKPGAAKPMATVYIPVVVHVMHTGGAVGTIYNPSDAQIQGAIDYLNQVYAGTYPGMQEPVEGGGVVDMEIQFALAQRTPSCGATNGINRVDASSLSNYVTNGVNVQTTGGVSELTLKNFSRWDPTQYYNIWVVNKLDGADGTSGQFIAGFAYFPGASSLLDGTIMLATQMQTGRKTLPHEIGHALGLYHTFQGSSGSANCPANANCNTQGDMVCDTDPVSENQTGGIYNFACRTGANACATPNNFTRNTESNFMAYTNCYTLFTNGQKARAQAALSLASRASLIDPSNLALVPCGTTINFNTPGAILTESSTGTTEGCRTYTDYTYQLVIGTGPSATATATLSYGGTATKGLDYDVTTNGDFDSPSEVLTFTAGSTAAQSFTVRIYDDGNVESNETINLDFTIDNGGGDATKGATTPTLAIIVQDNDTAPAGAISGVVSVGGAEALVVDAPFNARLQQQRSQFLYKASEMASAGLVPGTINSMQLWVYTKASTRPFQNLTIKMANASQDYLINGSANLVSTMTTVYTNASYSTAAGWNNFVLTTPFEWTGGALAIEICFSNATADAANGADEIVFYSDGGAGGQGNFVYRDEAACSGSWGTITYYNGGYKPSLRLGITSSGTEVETLVTGPATMHLDNGSNDYLYSENDRLMVRLNSINTSLGCVSASVEEAGTDWVSYQGGERSAKVFSINPTSNGGTAGYTVSLYFDNSELDGKNPASLRIAKTSAASVASSNAGNTIFVTPTVTTLGPNVTVFTASFTGFSKFFLVDGGAVLPVVLHDFNGTLNQDYDAVLQWRTSYEQNSLGFDVETSTDGNNFTKLAFIPSQGNSTADQSYQYIHIKPSPGVHYYRLKQMDMDGRYTYSNIITLEVAPIVTKPVIYPVPAGEQITIHFGQLKGRGEIEIYTADLKLVLREQVADMRLLKQVAISHFSPGVYFMRYNNGKDSGVMSFIKK